MLSHFVLKADTAKPLGTGAFRHDQVHTLTGINVLSNVTNLHGWQIRIYKYLISGMYCGPHKFQNK
jgi:hypothetical protein